MAKAKQETAIATVPSLVELEKSEGFLAPAAADEAAAAFSGALTETQQTRAIASSITIIKPDHKTEMWTVNGELVDAVEGYPIFYFHTRTYWKDPYKAGKNDPPNCLSPDGVIPLNVEGKQASSCASCQWSQFGTAKVGDGQACRQNTFLFLLNPDFGSPPLGVVILPPTSIKPLIGSPRNPGYLARAQEFKNPKTGKRAGFYEIVWSRFQLDRASDTYCVVMPTPIAVAPSAAEARAIGMLRAKLMAYCESMRGEANEHVERPND